MRTSLSPASSAWLMFIMFSCSVATGSYNWNQQLKLADEHYNNANFPEALQIYELVASETANQYAQFKIAWINERGLGRKRNCREAARWYTLAAQQGSLAASNNLYVLYSDGCPDLMRNDTLAIFYLKIAADGGDSRAEANLAWRYVEGEGVEKNIYLAYDLARKSATQSDPFGILALATFYETGVAVELDHQRAITLLEQVANIEAGDYSERAAQSRARARLGAKHVAGEGVVQDLVEGYFWFLLAAAGVDAEITPTVEREIEALRPRLSSDERKRTELRAQRTLKISTVATRAELLQAFKSARDEGRMEDARYIAESLADRNDPLGQFHLGGLFVSGEAGLSVDSDEAFIYFKRSCEGGYWVACVRKAYVLNELERHQRLGEFLPFVVQNMPNNAESRLELANLYLFLDKVEWAENLVRQVLIENPSHELALKILNEMQ